MAIMTLDEFVQSSLTNILKGIAAAQKDGDVREYVANHTLTQIPLPPASGVVTHSRGLATTVRFDVGVSVESKAEGGAGARFNIGVIGGNVGGDVAERHEGTNRIQFSVPVMIPEHRKAAARAEISSG